MPVTLDDVLDDVQKIAEALGVASRGRRLVSMLRRRLDTVREVVHANNMISQPALAHVEWLAPLMGSGYWVRSQTGSRRGGVAPDADGGRADVRRL